MRAQDVLSDKDEYERAQLNAARNARKRREAQQAGGGGGASDVEGGGGGGCGADGDDADDDLVADVDTPLIATAARASCA